MKVGCKLLPAIFAMVLMMVTPDGHTRAQSSPGPAGPEEDAACPDERAWTGKYHNYNYDFSITIPESLKGFWNGFSCVDGADGCVCMQDHGRTIPLTAEPHDPSRLIEVYAGYTDEPDLAHIVSFALRSMRHEHPTTLEIRKRAVVTLAGLKGERVVVRFYDAKLRRWQKKDLVALERDNVEYLLYLLTPESKYMHDRKLFETMIGSFALAEE